MLALIRQSWSVSDSFPRGGSTPSCALGALLVFLATSCAPAGAGAQTVQLFWDPPDDPSVVAQAVQWGTRPGDQRASAVVGAREHRFESPPLHPGFRYYFVVRAVDGAGRWSAPSNEISVVVPTQGSVTVPADARWEAATVTVNVAGSGSGHVTSSPAGITCGDTCAAVVPAGTPVTLAASPLPGHRFVGWDGEGCSGVGTCTVEASNPLAITARFEADPAAANVWQRYLAEGAASAFFDTRLALANPGGRDAVARLQFLREDGVVVRHVVDVPALTTRVLHADSVDGLADAAFATVVESDAELVVDRTMAWRTPSGSEYGAHAESSVPGPAPRWYLAEGATHAGFDLFYLLLNPHPHPVPVRVRYLRAGAPSLDKVYELAPASRRSIWVDLETFGPSAMPLLGDAEVSAVIETLDGSGIVVERAMYDSRAGQPFTAGHESAGVTAPAERWYFAEGATGAFFDLFLLLANPDDRDADVTVTYLRPDAAPIVRTHRVPAGQRYTIRVDDEAAALADTAVSAVVESSSVPIVAERSMWWPGDARTWTEAHNAPGATRTGQAWAVADGAVAGWHTSTATYLLVANPTLEPATVRVTLLFEPGVPTVSRTFEVGAGRRFGIDVAAVFPEAAHRRFGALVESLGPAAPGIVVERAMYADGGGVRWASGTNVLATRLR